MANMSYCRWENTYRDFMDCVNHLRDENTGELEIVSDSENRARTNLIELAASFLEEIGYNVYPPEENERLLAKLNMEDDNDE